MHITYEKHTLANGLDVVLHEDHSDPIVAVFVYYHVGSSREELGKSGFAHLFEHMLFQGSQNVGDDQHFKLIQEAGGTLNGTTNQDRTNYFETLPANQLELALWLESDRMGFLLPAMTQAKLDNQRDVVMNERRQSYENRPYGLVYETVLEHLYEEVHPYSWPTIGSMDDIAAASLEDVERFFRRWYGPNNATLAIGGDIAPAEALALVERYFGAIPRGPAVDKPRPRPAELTSSRRLVIEDRIQLPQLTLVWPTVEAWHPHEARINLLADLLAANKSSILDNVLMIQEELASVVTVAHRPGERAGALQINLRPNPGVSLGRLEQRLNELVGELVREGVDAERLERLKNRREGWLIRHLETVSGRTARLGHDNCFSADPERVREELANHRAVTPEEVLDAARTYLHEQPRIVLSTVPAGQRELAAPADPNAHGQPLEERAPVVDTERSAQPAPGAVHAFRTPAVWHAELANGVRVTGAPFDKVPLTRLSLAVPAGHLRETQDELGLAHITAKMLEEGTAELSGSELTDALDGMGGEYSVSATDDEIVLRMSVLSDHAAEAARLLADTVLRPRFSEEDFARVQRQQLVDIDTRADRIRTIASDAFARRVHGESNKGFPDVGTRETVERLTVADVRSFWKTNAVPGAARLCFVGEQVQDEVVALFAELAARWEAGPIAPPASHESADMLEGVTIYLVDKPGAKQSELRIGHRGLALNDPDYYPLVAMNYPLGGSFSSRINMNLREDKGYTYGARSLFTGGLTPGAFTVSTAVKTQDTAPAVAEVLRELEGIVTGVTEAEVEFTRQALSQALGRTFESARARLTLTENIAKYGWSDDYPEQRLAFLGDMSAADLSALARNHLHPERVIVVVVGDRDAVRADLEGLGRGEVVELNLAGEPLASVGKAH